MPTNASLTDATEGFTLVEMSAALVILSLVGGFALSSYLFFHRWQTQWQAQIHLQNQTTLLLTTVRRDLAEAAHVTQTSPQTWTLTYLNRQALIYVLAGTRLTRNSHPLHAPTLQVNQFHFALLDALGQEGNTAYLSLTLQTSHAADTLRLRTAFRLRQPRGWTMDLPPDNS